MLNRAGDIVPKDIEKSSVLNALSLLKLASGIPGPSDKWKPGVWKTHPQVMEHLNNLDILKFMALDEVHP